MLIDSSSTRNDLLEEIGRLRCNSETQSKHLAEALKEKNDLAARNCAIKQQLDLERNRCEEAEWHSQATKEQKDDLQKRYDTLVDRQPALPKFRVGQFVMSLGPNPKWDSTNGTPYRIDKAVVRITRVVFVGTAKPYYIHSGLNGNSSIPEVWFRALRPEEI